MKKDDRRFEEVVRSIEMSESDVDKILKAARLSRVEKPKMSDARFEMICGMIIITLIIASMVGLFALAFILG